MPLFHQKEHEESGQRRRMQGFSQHPQRLRVLRRVVCPPRLWQGNWHHRRQKWHFAKAADLREALNRSSSNPVIHDSAREAVWGHKHYFLELGCYSLPGLLPLQQWIDRLYWIAHHLLRSALRSPNFCNLWLRERTIIFGLKGWD